MESNLFFIVPIGSLIALAFAFVFYRMVMKENPGNDAMKEIEQHVGEGMIAYFKKQYLFVGIAFAGIAILLAILAVLGIQNPFVPFAFLTGGIFSVVCGFFGMKTAVAASSRTAEGARQSLNKGFQIALRSSAVLGLAVVGFGLLDISLWYIVLNAFYDNNIFNVSQTLAIKAGLMSDSATFDPNILTQEIFKHSKLVEITATMVTFVAGASVHALFSRVAGSMFAQGTAFAATFDFGVSSDDRKNPVSIAKGVSEHVSGIVAMGADLYESYASVIIAAAVMGAAFILPAAADENAVVAPMIVATLAVLLSIGGIFLATAKDDADAKTLMATINRGIWGSSFALILVLAALAYFRMIPWGVFGATVSGLITGLIVGQSVEFFTSDEYKPAQGLAGKFVSGVPTGLLEGFANGMLSSSIPVAAIIIGVLASYGVAGGFSASPEAVAQGLYGVVFAAVGMVSILGISLAVASFGSIAQSAALNAKLSGAGESVRSKADSLSLLGKATGAAGKGIALASAGFAGVALLAVYLEEIKLWIGKFSALSGEGFVQIGAIRFYNNIAQVAIDPTGVLVQQAQLSDLVRAYEMNVMNPKVLAGLFIGAMLILVFSALTIKGISKLASSMIEEVKKQIKDSSGKPDYSACVGLSVKLNQKNMIIISALVILVPVFTGLILGVPGTVGLLAGMLVTGFVFAFFFNNSGISVENAKRYIEKGNAGGKGSDAYKAACQGFEIGEPLQEAAGPSINTMIKIMCIMAILVSGLTVKASPVIAKLLGF